jgi:Zn-dependent protease with chaperone function
MRGVSIVKNFLSRFVLLRLMPAVFLLLLAAAAHAAEGPIAVFPAAPYDGYLIYESLAVFWIAIIGLIVIIRMKLREIERTQEMGADLEESDIQLLQ